MCLDVFIEGKGILCGTQGDLAAAIGKENFVKSPCYPDSVYDDRVCLCPIDLDETGKKAGYEVSSTGKDGFVDCCTVYYRVKEGK